MTALVEANAERRVDAMLKKPEIQQAYAAFEVGLMTAGPIYGTEEVVRAFAHGLVSAYVLGLEDALAITQERRNQRTGDEPV